ncbi:MAG: sigma 54-interacting transcriptional regulator [Nannocystaceae bacterium]|nr:sigma 54-interacting transcriptional regulator [Nannocystaceae bacterium]
MPRERVESLARALECAGAAVVRGAAAGEMPGVIVVGERLGARARAWLARGGATVVCATLGRGSADAWAWLRAGASDVIAAGDPRRCADELLARLQRDAGIDALLAVPQVRARLVGDSPAWRRALREVAAATRFGDGTILLAGESGTGKELVAGLVHELGGCEPRAQLHVLDCSTVVESLSGSEFFGHERGAFTGAHEARDGAFARADGGTLLLDEIGELPLRLQAQLLRAVQERSYKRVGGNAWHTVRCRIVCATHRDLAAMVARGEFREDLYHRLAGAVVRLPPLRERGRDVVLLARHLLRAHGCDAELDDAVEALLLQRDYPGNVRELRQLVGRMAARHVGVGPVTVGCVAPMDWPAAGEPIADGPSSTAALRAGVREALRNGAGLREIGRAAEELAIELALDDSNGRVATAAQSLKVTDRALQLRRAARRDAPRTRPRPLHPRVE